MYTDNFIRRFLKRILKLPSYELCGSKIYKTYVNNGKIGKESIAYWISYVLIWLLCVVVVYVTKGFAMFVGLMTLILLRTLIDYDFDALLCYYNKKSECIYRKF